MKIKMYNEVLDKMPIAQTKDYCPKDWNPPPAYLAVTLARENEELSEKIFRLKLFLGQTPEEKASQKQIELMKKQLNAMECYKIYLCCRIADLVISDIEPSEEKKGA